MIDDDHRNDARFISHLKHELGYDLATCRNCNFVAEVKLVRTDKHTSIELMG